MSTPSFEQVAMKLKASGVPFNATTIQRMCGCGGGDVKNNMSDLQARKMCGCGGHLPELPRKRIQ